MTAATPVDLHVHLLLHLHLLVWAQVVKLGVGLVQVALQEVKLDGRDRRKIDKTDQYKDDWILV